VLLIQPPVYPAVETDTPLREPPVPPWDMVCLHAYLLSRTGHQCTFFDARLYADWPRILEQSLPYDTHQLVVVVRARTFEWPAALQVLRTMAELAPPAMRVLFGPLASACPDICLRRPELEAALVGDPELTLRALLENRHAPGRLRQIPGLAMPDRPAEPTWAPDLQHLPAPAWDRLPWKDYTRLAQGGLRALIRLSRGHPGQPGDRAVGGRAEPLRFMNMERLLNSFGRSAHLGVVETLIVDPPGIWNSDRLRLWCLGLQTLRNTHPWSIQLLPHTLSPDDLDHLRDAACRRIELILPSARPEELSRFGVRGDARSLEHAILGIAQSGLEVLLRVWVGGPCEGPREREQWLRLLTQLRFPPVRFQPFPFALDAPMVNEVTPPPGTPDLTMWLAEVDHAQAPVMAWGGPAGRRRALALCQELERAVREGWRARWHRWWTRWRDTSIIDQLEQRATELLRDSESLDAGGRPPAQR